MTIYQITKEFLIANIDKSVLSNVFESSLIDKLIKKFQFVGLTYNADEVDKREQYNGLNI